MAFEVPSNETLAAATPEELAALAAACLSLLEPGRQPYELFMQFARHCTLSTIEVAPLRPTRKGLEVLLGQRPAEDELWANKWHIPGTVCVPQTISADSNETVVVGYEGVADALLARETNKGVERVGAVRQYNAQIRVGARGTEQTVFLWTPVEEVGEPTDANYAFFNVNNLLAEPPKEGLIAGHDRNVLLAAESYRKSLSLPQRLLHTIRFGQFASL